MKNAPSLHEMIQAGWAYGYSHLESSFKALDDGKITEQEFNFRLREYRSKTKKGTVTDWVWFPSFRGFTGLLEEFRAEKGALLVYACIKRNLKSLREGSEFENYREIYSSEGEHIAILGKPSWEENRTESHPGRQSKTTQTREQDRQDRGIHT